MKYRIYYKGAVQWTRILGAGFLGAVCLLAFIVVIATDAEADAGFYIGTLVIGIGGPIYAWHLHAEAATGLPVLEADETGLTVLFWGEPRHFDWSEVSDIRYARDNARHTMSIKIPGADPLVNHRGSDVAVALQQHEVVGRTKDHAAALTRLWDAERPSDQ